VMSAVLALLLHESSVSSSRLEVKEREVLATFTFSLEDLAGLARLDLNRNGIVEPEEWARALPAITAYVGEKFRIEKFHSEGLPCSLPPLPLSEGRAPIRLQVRYVAPEPFDRMAIRCDLFAEHGGNPRHIAELADGRTLFFDRDRSRIEVGTKPRAHAGMWTPALAIGLLVVASSLALFRARGIILAPRKTTRL